MTMATKVLATLGLMVLLSSHGAVAQSPIPDIEGHWDVVGSSGAGYAGGIWAESSAPATLEIQEQEGHAFVGVWEWSTGIDDDEPTAHDGTQHTHEAVEDILGVFTGNGASFVIAESPDTGYMFGQILDHNRMEVVYAESGPYAVAIRYVFERRQ